MPDEYYNILIKLSKKASKNDEVPVSALLVKDGQIIAKDYNKREKKHSIIAHAEILVINKAAKKLKTWHLDECALYVTLKPCNMCMEIIKQSRIKNVFYLVDKPKEKKEYSNKKIERTYVCSQEQEYLKILNNFFQKKRDKKKHI